MGTRAPAPIEAGPFAEGAGPFVATPPHAEAVARLVHIAESGDRLGLIRAETGLGKSAVLAEALRRCRHPRCRVVLVSAALGTSALLASLARGIARSPARGPERAEPWEPLLDSLRQAAQQGYRVVLGVDGLDDNPGTLVRLSRLGEMTAGTVTVLAVGRPSASDGGPTGLDWTLRVNLVPLSRNEAGAYLRRKLSAAGRDEGTFTARAVTRLHALSGGVPRGLDRLALLALAAASASGEAGIGAELVDQVAAECPATVGM